MRRAAATVMAMAGFGLALAGVATAQVPPTLTGESFQQDRPALTALDCNQTTNFSYLAKGTATGPYPGTYTETGTLIGNRLVEATFTIDSPAGQVTGTKTGFAGTSCALGPGCSGVEDCDDEGASFNTTPQGGFSQDDVYEATITTSVGVFTDRGLFNAVFYHSEDGSPLDGFDSAFQSQLDAPIHLRPTTREQCRKGGWQNFAGQFDNQGECVQFVRHLSRQECIFERAAHGRAAFRAKYGSGVDERDAMRRCVRQQMDN